MKKNSLFSLNLIWIGAGLSIAEIVTGTYFAPLGFSKGLLAVVLGHIIGGVLMFLCGSIGSATGKNSMQTSGISFGSGGAKFFAIFNILQLVGWTGVMIHQGSEAAVNIFPQISSAYFKLIIATLVILWLVISKKDLNIINTIVVSALFVLTIFLFAKVFGTMGIQKANSTNEVMSFVSALELSIAMPVSWLPLISDYTADYKDKFKPSLTSTLSYSLVSIWMYIIGMSIALFTKESELGSILSKIGGFTGLAGLYVVVLSTVTTTYLDAYSIGVSALSISKKSREKLVSVIAVILATGFSLCYNLNNIENFLYLIGSIFVPMAIVLILDYFVFKAEEDKDVLNYKNLFVWVVGFFVYRYFMNTTTVLASLGSTIPTCIAVYVLLLFLNIIEKSARAKN